MKKWLLANKYYLLSFLVILILVLMVCYILFKKVNVDDSVFEDVTFIGHGLYGIDNKDYSNSLESLVLGYNNGIRIMEADFLFTSDGKIVLNHYWEYSFWEVSSEFLNRKIYDKYTPMDIYDLLEYMEEYEDLYIIIDTKEDEYNNGKSILDVYREIVNITSTYNEDLLDRFIVQIYNCENYEQIVDIYDFKNKLVTVYKMYPFDLYRVIYFCLKNDIGVMVIPYWYIEDGTISVEQIQLIKSKNIKVYVHTINDENIYNDLLNIGIDGVYTDFLY